MWPNLQENAYLVIFTKEILLENLIFFCSDDNDIITKTFSGKHFPVYDMLPRNLYTKQHALTVFYVFAKLY